jgi:hypothetical protein
MLSLDETPSVEIRTRETIFTPIGTYKPTRLAEIGGTMVKDGVFIDRRNGTPMEMDAYGAYLALKGEERRSGVSKEGDRRAVVARLEARREACGGFWTHGAWTKSDKEIHLRFTAAAVRLLTEAHADGLYPNTLALTEILKRHLSYRETLTPGVWFLHDTLELPDIGIHVPELPLPSDVWGSTTTNCLVLNTHVDTLITLIDALERVDLAPADRAELEALTRDAVGTLFFVLKDRSSLAQAAFSVVDGLIRHFMFSVQNTGNRILNYAKWRIIDHYYKFRRNIKIATKSFIFSDGYLERDIGLQGYFFDYHIYNLHDLARFALIARRNGFIDAEQSAQLAGVIHKAIDYACANPYLKLVQESLAQNGRMAVLCEAMLARAALTSCFAFPAAWSRVFAEVTAAVAPTPALLGYDPHILRSATEVEGHTTYELLDGSRVCFDRASGLLAPAKD